MYNMVALFSFVWGALLQEKQGSESTKPTYGYIVLAVLILIAVVIVLVRRQHRKFNE